MIYKLIYKSFGKMRRGACTSSHFLSKYSNIESYNIKDIKSISDIRDSKSNLVFVTQIPSLYSEKYSFINAKKSDRVFLRSDETVKIYKSFVYTTNNGFSHSKNINSEYYTPILYKFSNIKFKNTDKIILGYYFRPGYTIDSSFWFQKFLSSLPFKVVLYTMGAKSIFSSPNIIKHIHTYDNVEFFDNVTHYLYFKSNEAQDPYPSSLMEAIQSGCQIIVPNNIRYFKDGIDDILSTIKYHTELNYEIFDNSKTPLNSSFQNYTKELIKRGFLYTHYNELKNYKNFNEWLEKEL